MKKLILWIVALLLAPTVFCVAPLLVPSSAFAEEWKLELRYGITGWGAGGFRLIIYPSEDACYKALQNIIITGTHQESGDDDEQVIAFCAPSKERK